MTIWVRSEDKSDFARMTIGGVSSDDDLGLAVKTIWVRSEDKSDFARMTNGGVSSDDIWDKDSDLAL